MTFGTKLYSAHDPFHEGECEYHQASDQALADQVGETGFWSREPMPGDATPGTRVRVSGWTWFGSGESLEGYQARMRRERQTRS